MKKVMIFFLLMLVSSSAYSQLQQVTLLDPDKIYVNGLEAYCSYSHQEVIDALGTPDKMMRVTTVIIGMTRRAKSSRILNSMRQTTGILLFSDSKFPSSASTTCSGWATT